MGEDVLRVAVFQRRRAAVVAVLPLEFEGQVLGEDVAVEGELGAADLKAFQDFIVAALGVVSLVVPERRAWTGAALAPYIRLDLGLQPTAVGGAVIDAHGRVIGIATPRFARFGAIAVPAPTVNGVVDVLLQKGRIPRGYLGVGLQPVRLPDALRRTLQRDDKTAAIVLEVEPEGPAHKAGIVIGDIFVAFAGHPVSRLEDVHGQLGAESVGKSLPIKFVRGGALQETNIVVGERSHGAK